MFFSGFLFAFFFFFFLGGGGGEQDHNMYFCFQILACRFLDVADDLTLLLFPHSRQQTKDPRKELATTLSEARLQIHKDQDDKDHQTQRPWSW